jgi:hypothetical protein
MRPGRGACPGSRKSRRPGRHHTARPSPSRRPGRRPARRRRRRACAAHRRWSSTGGDRGAAGPDVAGSLADGSRGPPRRLSLSAAGATKPRARQRAAAWQACWAHGRCLEVHDGDRAVGSALPRTDEWSVTPAGQSIGCGRHPASGVSPPAGPRLTKRRSTVRLSWKSCTSGRTPCSRSSRSSNSADHPSVEAITRPESRAAVPCRGGLI